ncbi:penicillin-binding protein 1A [Clostridia bacterium]|nr:penicillin-binding protein 1A [Clostridia bacterium]
MPKKQSDGITQTAKKSPSKVKEGLSFSMHVLFKIFTYIINIVLTLLLIGIITGGIVAGAMAMYVKTYIDPSVDDLATVNSSQDKTTVLYYYEYDDPIEHTNPQAKELDTLHSTENRFWVSFSKIPKNLVNAFLAIEDHRFFEHQGVDWTRSAAAVLNFFIPSGKVFGGSTLTQQLVKMMTKDDDQRIQRKIREILRAIALEKKTSKEDILETYLNSIFLSNRCFGVQAAANEFFNKDVSELSLIECAALASIVKSPSKYDPIRNPEYNAERRNVVLVEMRRYGYISQEEYDATYEKELQIVRPETTIQETVKSYYVDQVIEDVMADLMEKYAWPRELASHYVFSQGLSIYTCMDKSIQDTMEYVYMSEHSDDYFPASVEGAIKPQSAMVILEPTTGNLLGIVGGRGDKVPRGLNRATGSRRQPGSAIKPVASYSFAIDRGLVNYGSVIDDAPVFFLNDEKSDRPKAWPPNLPIGYDGYVTLNRALEVSKNTVAVNLVQQLTPEAVFTHLRDNLGISSIIEQNVLPNGYIQTDIDYSPMALGGMTFGVSVYELAGAYTILANRGIYSEPRSYTVVKDQLGNIIMDNTLNQKIVIDETTASIMTKMMQKVVESGTGASLPMKNSVQVAAKTGTTNEDYDRWFMGFTPYYICGVWYGYDQNKSLMNSTVTYNPPMLLFNYVMDTIHQKFYALGDDIKKFEMSPNIIEADYCKDSGMMPTDACKLDYGTLYKTDTRGSTRIERGYFVRGSEPKEPCDVHVIVDWDTSTGSVAGPGCPSESIRQIALVRNEKREYPFQITIKDAQYTWRYVDEDFYQYPSATNVPFYQNILPEGTYAGSSGVNRPVNSYCVEHNHEMTLPYYQRKSYVDPMAVPETTEASDITDTLEDTNPPDETTTQQETLPSETEPEVPPAVVPTTEEQIVPGER